LRINEERAGKIAFEKNRHRGPGSVRKKIGGISDAVKKPTQIIPEKIWAGFRVGSKNF
jgi:hypothetical protein